MELFETIKRNAVDIFSEDELQKRLISGRGVKVNGEVLYDSSVLIRNDCILSCGKNKFVQVCIKA